jgi:hypothetical protein
MRERPEFHPPEAEQDNVLETARQTLWEKHEHEYSPGEFEEMLKGMGPEEVRNKALEYVNERLRIIGDELLPATQGRKDEAQSNKLIGMQFELSKKKELLEGEEGEDQAQAA